MKKVIRVESRESSGRVSSYRDLVAWRKSMDLLVAIYALTESFPKNEQFGLTSQIKRAAVSIPSNIAEGSSRRSTQEFLRYLNIATGSLAEVETQLSAAQRLGFISLAQEEPLQLQCNEISRILQGLYDSLKSRLATRLSTLDSDH
jgi:four helix bundle protein